MSISMEFQPLDGTTILPFTRRDISLMVILILSTLALYLRVCHFDFVTFDDQLYVSSNIYVQQGLSFRSIRWAMTALPNGNWHPLTTLVQVGICNFFGMHAGVYHAANVLLHALNVVLLYVFLRQSTGKYWPAFFAALLWGLHPQRVESVAWVSELKDVLCGAFWLGCMLAYLQYSRRRTVGRWLIVALLMTLSLLSKPMAITLPAVLLLLDYWPLNRVQIDGQSQSAFRWWSFRILEKLPMVFLSLLDTRRQNHLIEFSSPHLGIGLRIQNGLVSYVLYIRDAFFPRHLGVLYPHPYMFRQPGHEVQIPLTAIALSIAVLILISVWVFLRARAQPYLLVGWCWFLGTLVPVIGLVQVGQQARADRFAYMPAIGIVVALVWLVNDLIDRASQNRAMYRNAALMTAIIAAVILCVVSEINIGYWKNSQTLFDHLLVIQPNNYLAIATKSGEFLQKNDVEQALELGRKAVAISPASQRAHNAYGNALRVAGQLDKAAEQFQLATAIDADDAASWDALGRVRDAQANQLADRHDPHEADFRARAVADFRNAVSSDPDQPDGYEHLAFQLELQGNLDQAIGIWEQVLDLCPSYGQAQGDLADALLRKGDIANAVAHYRAAIADGSKLPRWETRLAYLVSTDPQRTMAEVQPMIAIAKDACDQTHDEDADALDAYAACLARVGVFDLAIDSAQQAVARSNAAHNTTLAKAIQKRLDLYQQSKPYVSGDSTTTTTKPGY